MSPPNPRGFHRFWQADCEVTTSKRSNPGDLYEQQLIWIGRQLIKRPTNIKGYCLTCMRYLAHLHVRRGLTQGMSESPQG
jgi:hypothetical protein